jgi:hypothetical protein
MVVVQGDTVCRAGGFTSPDLDCITGVVRASQPAGSTESLAWMLAILADENGALEVFRVVNAISPLQNRARSAWLRRRPSNWPPDTSLAGPGGEAVVRFTVLSQQTRSYEQAWRASAYDFRFDQERHLLAWSRRTSDAFFPAADSRR